MKIEEALPKLNKIIYKKFCDLYEDYELENIIIAKGNTGKLLEKIISLSPGSRLRDFEDGELKTNKSRENGHPMETMFITQISTNIDELINKIPFKGSWVFQKIKQLVYLPVVKENRKPEDWYFLPYYLINLNEQNELFQQLENDFQSICKEIYQKLNTKDRMLHTTSGKFIQIRTKDAKPYNPIYSNELRRFVSNKNFAFYFKKEFMLSVQRIFPRKIKVII